MAYNGENKMKDSDDCCTNPIDSCFKPGKNGANCVEVWAQVYIQVVTIIMLALSIAIVAFGSYILVGIGDSLSSLELKSPAVATLVFGVFMFTFSFIGCAAATWENFTLKILFAVGSGFLTVGLLIAGIYINQYSDFLENVEALQLETGLEETILAYELAVFHECCDPNNAPPESCDEIDKLPCYADEVVYDGFLEFVGDRTCSVFSGIEYEGEALVGVEPEECGGQDLITFISLFSQYLMSQMGLVGGINIALGIVFLLLTLASIVLFYEDDLGRRKLALNGGDEVDTFVTKDTIVNEILGA